MYTEKVYSIFYVAPIYISYPLEQSAKADCNIYIPRMVHLLQLALANCLCNDSCFPALATLIREAALSGGDYFDAGGSWFALYACHVKLDTPNYVHP